MTQDSSKSPLAELIEQLLDEYKLKPRMREIQIRKIWTRIVGSYAASQTGDITLKNRVLYITIHSAALRHELSFAKSRIIRNINRLLGEDAVEDIRFF